MTQESAPEGIHPTSREITKRFLHNAVLLDDHLRLSNDDAPSADTDVKEGDEPEAFSTESQEEAETETTRPNNPLFVDVLTKSFADEGLVCSVIQADRDDEYKDRLVSVASRADIVVLDWRIHGKAGDATLDIINRILAKDQEQARTRLIAIYTVIDLDQVKDKVKDLLANYYESFEIQEPQNAITKGPVRIVFINKNATLSEALPSRLVDEFSKMIIGILPGIAVAGLAALRSNAHELIAHFNEDMDPAYLNQRASLRKPPEAEQHLIDALAGEMQAIMENSKVGNFASSGLIREWVQIRYEKSGLYNKFKRKNGENKTEIIDRICKIIDLGWTRAPELHSRNKKNQETAAFAESEEIAKKADNKFASLLSLKQRYSNSIPILWLGTIVSLDENGQQKYFLCIKPKCDSTNLPDKEALFPFLPLPLIDDDEADGLINCIVRDGKDHVLVKIPQDLGYVITATFQPKNGEIETLTEDGQFFVDTKSTKWRWVAELKPQHAQRVANDMAAHTARVGLAESEWLRTYS